MCRNGGGAGGSSRRTFLEFFLGIRFFLFLFFLLLFLFTALFGFGLLLGILGCVVLAVFAGFLRTRECELRQDETQ